MNNNTIESQTERFGQRSILPRFTPEIITHLEPHEVFVFGSNADGLHMAGAAKAAHDLFGAEWGKPRGHQGQSYAIVTMPPATLSTIAEDIATLLIEATERTDLTFLVTKIGCGIAGYRTTEIAELFHRHTIPANVILPIEFSNTASHEITVGE